MKVTEFVRTPYNYDVDKASDESGLACSDPSLAQQSFKDECDINNIVSRFGVTGEFPSSIRLPTYGDFTGINDYRTALDMILAADESFMSLPAEVRERFNNDPAEFVDFCSDEQNLDELRKMGLAIPAEPDTAVQQPPEPSTVTPS